jgi:hypothetical protein
MTIPYVTGTVSVTGGSAVVIGSGTAWASALIAGGLFGLDSSNGNPVPILSVDSNTQLTLAKPWRGTTAAGQGYWIVRDTAYLQQQTVNAQALSTYIQRLDNAALAVLAGLTPAADKLAYFTGPSGAALTDIKAKGRDIMAATDMLNLLAKLGPVNGGVTALAPNASGVGLSDGDFNTITVAGTYSITGNWVNGFQGAGSAAYSGILNVYVRGSQVYQYLLINTSFAPQWHFRFSANGTTGTWPDRWWNMAGEVVGTVAQSSGRSIGAVIERGSNANGEYARFADGTQICTFAAPGVDTTITSGPLFRSPDYSWTYPVAFAATPTWSVSVQASSRWGNCRQTSGTTVGTFNQYSTISSTSVLAWSLTAIGRWF